MARRTRCSDAGYVYHVLNHAAGRAILFDEPADYAAFEKVLCQAWERTGIRLMAYVAIAYHLARQRITPDHLSPHSRLLRIFSCIFASCEVPFTA